METIHFAEIEAEFNARVQKVIWCNMSTVDHRQRPRSRIVHPVWEGVTGWLTSRRQAYKAKHLALNPHVSFAYVSDPARPVYVDCIATWEDNLDEKNRVWDYLKSIPAPYGFDPVTLFASQEDPKYGLLRLRPWRIELCAMPEPSLIWRDKTLQTV